MFLVVCQPRRFVAQNDKEIEGLGWLPGICSEFARNLRNSEFARKLLGIHLENGPDQPCAELSSVWAVLGFEELHLLNLFCVIRFER